MSKLEKSRSPELVEVLRAVMDKALSDVYVALPGKVEKYDAQLQKADVKPLIQEPYINEDGTEGLDDLPVLTDVPVWFPRGGGYFLSLPVQTGDNVLLIFNDLSIDNFMASVGSRSLDPVDLRKHDISDAVAIPGFYPFPKNIKDTIASGAAFGKEGGAMMRATGAAMEAVTGGAPAAADFVALAAKVLAELTKIQVALNTHVHTGVTTGVGNTGTSVSGYSPDPVASSNLKAD